MIDNDGIEELLKKVASLLEETDLSEIEIEKGDTRVRLARSTTPVVQPPPVYNYTPPPVDTSSASPVAPAKESVLEVASPVSGETIDSPMVGTIYLSPSPDSATFVQVGDKISKGQTILIIEAMKTMNNIPSPLDGVVKSILVKDGQPVEFGEPLITIE